MPDAAPQVHHFPGDGPSPAIDLTPLGVPDAQTRRRHGPDWTLVAPAGAVPAACCSVWMQHTPRWEGRAAGVIGHFGASDASAAQNVLREASALLRNAGLEVALGPIDGTTWRRYRLVTTQHAQEEPGTAGISPAEPPFFMEPQNPPAYVDYFTSAGFDPVLMYHSSITSDLATADIRAADAALKLADKGVQLRPIAPARFEDELRNVYRLSLEEFAGNPLYTPIDEEEFIATYRGIAPHLVPELVQLAEHEGNLVGFVFAMPDLAQAHRGEAVDRVIIKTLAVAQAWRGAGLGGVLLDRMRATAHTLGFGRAIYALMHDANPSSRLASRFGRPFRRYAVFGRELGGGRP